MRSIISKLVIALSFFFIQGTQLWAQEAELSTRDNRPVKNIFESIWIIDNQTVVVPVKGTIEFDILHRFGVLKNSFDDLFWLNAPANIRLGFGYAPVKNLLVGFGITKSNLTWDFNAKYALLHQTRSGSIPVSITYYGNAAVDTRKKEVFTNPDALGIADRLSFFHQILIARKFSDKLSVQVAGSLSHFNTVEAFKNPDNENDIIEKWKNDHFGAAVSARYQISSTINLLVNFDQPITTHEVIDPQPNYSFGLEFSTSSHQFQVFAGNYYNILPQRNNVFNTNKAGDGQFLIGFNMTKLWN